MKKFSANRATAIKFSQSFSPKCRLIGGDTCPQITINANEIFWRCERCQPVSLEYSVGLGLLTQSNSGESLDVEAAFFDVFAF